MHEFCPLVIGSVSQDTPVESVRPRKDADQSKYPGPLNHGSAAATLPEKKKKKLQKNIAMKKQTNKNMCDSF